MLRRFKISEMGIHVGLMRFSSRASTIFGFEQYFTHREINAAIDRMRYQKGGTRTDRALRLARNKLFLEKPAGMARPNIPKFLVLMTDGISTHPKITAMEASLLKKKGVHVIVVAIGQLLYTKELIAIASTPRDVITVTSFAKLKRIVAITKEKVCGGEFVNTDKSHYFFGHVYIKQQFVHIYVPRWLEKVCKIAAQCWAGKNI